MRSKVSDHGAGLHGAVLLVAGAVQKAGVDEGTMWPLGKPISNLTMARIFDNIEHDLRKCPNLLSRRATMPTRILKEGGENEHSVCH
jgi:hypothetical protein